MGEDTARLREEIEATREDLSRDVDAVAFKASPQRIVNDRVDAAKSKVTDMKERVMGSAQDARDRVMGSAQETTASVQGSLSSAAHSSSDTLHSAAETAREAPGQVADQVTYRTRGNPLAAGLIAFGVGWLVSSLLPATRVETRAVEQGKELAQEHGVVDQVKQEVKAAGQEIGEHLRPAAQDAVEQVKSTAAEGAQAVKEHGTQAAQTVKEEAAYQAQDAKAQHTSGGSGSSNAAGQFSTNAEQEELTPVYVETVDVTRTEVIPEGGRPTGAV